MKFIILGSLCLLSYEDIRYKTVPIWQLAILGIVCGINMAYTGDLMKKIPADILWGFVFGVGILLISVLTGWIGAGDGIVMLFLGIGLGAVKMINIFCMALVFMAVGAGILIMCRKIYFKYQMPFIPFIFLAAMGVMLCG